MRVEEVRGRYLLCGGILPKEDVKVGQQWAAADGSDHVVTVTEVDRDWVTYESTKQPPHTKLNFAFQCRYCLVVPSAQVPDEYLED